MSAKSSLADLVLPKGLFWNLESSITFVREPTKLFERRTRVFWNIEDASVFKDIKDPYYFKQEVVRILGKEGFGNFVSIICYVDEGDLPRELVEKWWEAGIFISQASKSDGVKKLDFIFVDILVFANNTLRDPPSNVLLITEKFETYLHTSPKYSRFLAQSHSKSLNVCYADPLRFLSSNPKGSINMLGISRGKQYSLYCSYCGKGMGSTSSVTPEFLSQLDKPTGLCDACSKNPDLPRF